MSGCAPSPERVRYPTDRGSLERDCAVSYVRGSGPGGQHRNKRETGIRLTHRPSGVVVHATERRERTQNLELAFERVARKLERLNHIEKPRRPTRATRASRRRRLEAKRRLSQRKAGRRWRPGDD